MLSLRETQIAFCAAIRADGGAAPDGLIVDDDIAPERRVQIYRNNHRLGALAAMQANYPVVERLGGAEWFAQSVLKYQGAHPSNSGDLQNLGAHYPQFLADELADGEYSYFADVARLEWAYQLAMTAPERGPVDIAVLQAFSPQDYENLRFIPRPACSWSNRPTRSSQSGRPISRRRRRRRRSVSMRATAGCS
jgi:hypothetical protein